MVCDTIITSFRQYLYSNTADELYCKGDMVLKANESVKNYAASVRMYTNYTVREIKKICKEIGPRPAGSESEKKGSGIHR